MKIVDLPSPNFDERTAPVDMLVLHYTGMPSAQAALAKLQDATEGKRVSAHYVVDEDGTVYRMVPEDKRAWHAGVSSWRGNNDVNARSIGIEIVNPGHEFGYRPFPPAQMQAVAELARGIVERHGIPSWNVVAHSDVAPLRKEDPGELFDWRGLASQGVGLWPADGPKHEYSGRFSWVVHALKKGLQDLFGGGINVAELQKNLLMMGYDAPQCGTYGEDTTKVVTAFQRHFRPEKVDGIWDDECQNRLQALRERIPPATMLAPDGRMAARG